MVHIVDAPAPPLGEQRHGPLDFWAGLHKGNNRRSLDIASNGAHRPELWPVSRVGLYVFAVLPQPRKLLSSLRPLPLQVSKQFRDALPTASRADDFYECINFTTRS